VKKKKTTTKCSNDANLIVRYNNSDEMGIVVMQRDRVDWLVLVGVAEDD
jgi:hypothetical protein